MIIRPARREDVPAIAALAAQFAHYMRELGDTTPLQLDAQTLMRDGFGPNPAFSGLVAESAGVTGEVVGYLLHHPGYDTDAARRLLFVVDLYVAVAARGQGIATALMAEARQLAVGGGAAQLVWTVDRRNTRALRFYEGLGAVYADELALLYMDA